MSKHDCEACIHKVVCALWEIQNELCDSECAYYQPTLTPPNEPLTLEQLREMDGKPVWVEFEDGSGGLWGIVHISVFEQIVFPNGLHCTIGHPYYGKTYKAYAYPPAHIDREAWEPCGACKNGEITIHVPEFRAMAVCNQHMDHEAFDLTLRLKFCPWCGRPLTLEAWDELEQRLRGEQVDERERDQS